jgi:hypothetical protein
MDHDMMLRPFWRYYGGKWRAAPKYPIPVHSTIIEPFAGAAGYALHYPERNVVLVEKYQVVADIWRYLIAVKSAEILAIPEVEHVDDLPSWVPAGARSLVGFCMNAAVSSPRKQLSSGRKKLRAAGRVFEGWSEQQRARVASQVDRIRHWNIIEGSYELAPDIEATWFIDPPYQVAGTHYIHHALDYTALGTWCRARAGQVMVCENDGADWLPFVPFAACKKFKRLGADSNSHESIWTNDDQVTT